MQRALWEIPTDDLRGVAVGGDDDSAIVARFFYDGPVTDLHSELVSLAETYLIADYAEPLPTTRFEAVTHPSPAALDLGELTAWVYLRWEPSSWGNPTRTAGQAGGT
jgi:hypothetical protein